MRVFQPALVLILMSLGTSSVGCGGDSSAGGGDDDGALGDDGSLEDGSGGDAVEPEGDAVLQDVILDGVPEAALVDVAFADASPADGAPDARPAVDAGGGLGEGGLDATLLGTVVVTADASLKTTVLGGPCAAVSSLFAEPNVVRVGGSVRLTASGIDSANQNSDVTLSWAATGSVGSLTASNGSSNTFHCESAGVGIVTVSAAIADGGASCAVIGSLTAMVTCTAPPGDRE